MKFQDPSFKGLKVTVGKKSVTHPRTHAPKAICPINFFKVGGINRYDTKKYAVFFLNQICLLIQHGAKNILFINLH